MDSVYLLNFQLETEKNRLEMLLNNNLLKKLEQLQQELTEMKGEDRKQKLDMLESELKSVGDRLNFMQRQFNGTQHTLSTATSSVFVQRQVGFGDIFQASRIHDK